MSADLSSLSIPTLVRTLAEGNTVSAIAVSANGDLAFEGLGTVFKADGTPVPTESQHPFRWPCWSPNGEWVVGCSSGELRCLHVPTGTRRTYCINRMASIAGIFPGPVGSLVAVSMAYHKENSGEVFLCDASTGRQDLVLRMDTTHATAVAFSSDGSLFAVGCHEGRVRVIDARTCEAVGREAHLGGTVSGLAFHPTRSTVFAAAPNRIAFYDYVNGRTHAFPHEVWGTRLQVVAGGKALVSWNVTDQSSLTIWDTETGASRQYVLAQQIQYSGCFYDNGRMAAIPLRDGGVGIYDFGGPNLGMNAAWWAPV